MVKAMKMRKMRMKIMVMINDLVNDGLSVDASRILSRIIGIEVE